MRLGRRVTAFILHVVDYRCYVLSLPTFILGCAHIDYRKTQAESLLGSAATRKDCRLQELLAYPRASNFCEGLH